MPEAGESAAGTSEASKAPEESKNPIRQTKAPEATPTKQAAEPTKNQGGVVDEG